MKRTLAILFVCLPVLASDLNPPGFKPVLRSPKDAEQQGTRMVKVVTVPSVPSPVELVLTKWYVFEGKRVPQPAIVVKTNSPRMTIYSWVNGGWNCWTTLTNVRAGETREVGWCPTGRDYALWKVVLHD